MKIVWQAQAEAELDAATDYYIINAGIEVASDFRNEVRRITSRLREHPEIGIRIRHQSRRLPLHGYPYDLVYRLTPEKTLIVVALAHQHRLPGYWAGRKESVENLLHGFLSD